MRLKRVREELNLKRAELIVAHQELKELTERVERLEDKVDTLSKTEKNLTLNKQVEK